MISLQTEEITTKELLSNINKANYQVIDIRTSDYYNGWLQEEQSRSGHIKGARSIPYKFFKTDYISEILIEKGISKSDRLVIYGSNFNELIEVVDILTKQHFKKISVYKEFITTWTQKKEYPMEYLPRYKYLVPPNWLKNKIDNPKDNSYLIFQTFYHRDEGYKEGHIPESIKLDTNLFESTVTWNRLAPKELEENIRTLGITKDTTVVLYGRSTTVDLKSEYPASSIGHLGAFRIAVILLYAGVKDVRILNGGLQSWIDAGYETTQEEILPVKVKEFGCTIPKHPEYFKDLIDIKDRLDHKNEKLVSIRSHKEFIGEVSGYNYFDKRGRIPGSLYCNCGSDSYHMENFRNKDNTTREFNDILKAWADYNIIPSNKNIFYCGTGWKACEAWFNAWLAGWENISVYDGGWFEWSSDSNNPIETGVL